MNDATVTLIQRPYQEIVDDILTAIVGGVVNEPLRFDLKQDLYPLAQPARDVRGITGVHQQEPHTFQKGSDFLFSEGDNAVVWQVGGAWPDDETLFYVDYFRRDSRSPLTDINIGSVTRTLSEAIAREIAVVYEQVNQAYLAGFVDTATGKSLDLVVSILGLTRQTKDYAVGQATFFRDLAIEGNLVIPEGTVVRTAKDVRFHTTQPRALQRGQVRVDAPIRAAENFKGAAGKVDAGAINQLVQPIAGISRVTNLEATFLGAEDESDAELRLRAKAALRALGKGTLAALARVIAEARCELVEVWDPNSVPAQRTPPGSLTLLVGCEPKRFPSLRAAIEETRAAGIQTTLVARYIFLKPRLSVQLQGALPAAGKAKVQQDLILAIQNYIDNLTSGEDVKGTALLAVLKQTPNVKAVRFADVMTWRSDLDAPGPTALLETVLAAVRHSPAGDEAALRDALAQQLLEATLELAPTGSWIPDRGLVQGATGQRATDAEIESGNFTVVATIAGQPWWITLDMETTDIVLEEEAR